MKKDTPDPGQSNGDPSEVRDRLMERVRSGDPSEQDAAIAALIERVRLSKSWSDVPILARALLEARRFDNAIGVLDKLIKAFPKEERFRLDRAIANCRGRTARTGPATCGNAPTACSGSWAATIWSCASRRLQSCVGWSRRIRRTRPVGCVMALH